MWIASAALAVEIYGYSVLNEAASYELEPPGKAEMANRFAAVTGDGYPWLVADIEAPEADGPVVAGYAYAGPWHKRPAYRWTVEDSIYLDPAWRGRGIGRVLLVSLIERCHSAGFRQMIAVIGDRQPGSIALHRSLGFGEIGVIEGSGYKHGRWCDTVLMQKALGEGITTPPTG